MKTSPLRYLATVTNSNVDKLTIEGELPVRLCNYVDVYKNDLITVDMPFMKATATPSEIDKFRLQVGEVIITKDSEDRNDIAVPAYISETADDLLCGYHLAILRAKSSQTDGKFLFWALQAKHVREAISLEASGVTRFGLTLNGIKSVLLPSPSFEQQNQIANFLDRETSRIDRLIKEKTKQIELTKELLESECLRLLTRGLFSEDHLIADQKFEWIKVRPESWEPVKLKWFFSEDTNYSTDGSEVLFSLRMKEGLVRHNDVSDKPLLPENLIGYKRIESGQVVMNRMRAAIGLFGLASEPGVVSPDYSIFTVADKAYAPYFLRLFKTEPMMSAFRLLSKGLGNGSQGFMRLNADRFGSIKVAVPSYEEQIEVSKLVESKIDKASLLVSSIQNSISLLQEKRAALITAAVTGKLSVTTNEPANDNIPLLVAAQIISTHAHSKKFGRVKFQKLLYLAEAHCGVHEFNGQYTREAAGPLDRKLLNRIEADLTEAGWFSVEQSEDGGAVTYVALASRSRAQANLSEMLGDRGKAVTRLISKMRDMETISVEAVTTLYAVWNDFLIDGDTPTDEAIVQGVLEDWHPEKKDKFRADELQTWIGWMRRNDLVPTGQGPRTSTGRLFV